MMDTSSSHKTPPGCGRTTAERLDLDRDVARETAGRSRRRWQAAGCDSGATFVMITLASDTHIWIVAGMTDLRRGFIELYISCSESTGTVPLSN